MSDKPEEPTDALVDMIAGITLDVDVAPPWWTGGMEYTRAAAAAILDAGDDLAETVEFTIGIRHVSVRMFWPITATAADLAAWRKRMIARIEAQPGMAERKAQWTEWQNEKYGTPEEREARRLRTLERIRAQAVDEFVAGALA